MRNIRSPGSWSCPKASNRRSGDSWKRAEGSPQNWSKCQICIRFSSKTGKWDSTANHHYERHHYQKGGRKGPFVWNFSPSSSIFDPVHRLRRHSPKVSRSSVCRFKCKIVSCYQSLDGCQIRPLESRTWFNNEKKLGFSSFKSLGEIVKGK